MSLHIERVRIRDCVHETELPPSLGSLTYTFFLETKHFIYFYVGTLAILIWKS